MALHRQSGWKYGDRKEILKEVLNNDVNRLYAIIGSRLEDNPAAVAFRNEYLLHDVMASLNSNISDITLKPILDALVGPIIDLTQKFYLKAFRFS